MPRTKMPLSARAKQFLPFDAVKGLQQALRMKEYEAEAVSKGYLAEEEAHTVSLILSSLQGGETVEVRHYQNGHYVFSQGKAKLIYEEGYLLVDDEKILLKDLFGIRVLTR